MKLFLCTITMIVAVTINCHHGPPEPPDPKPPQPEHQPQATNSLLESKYLNATTLVTTGTSDKGVPIATKLSSKQLSVPWRDDYRCGPSNLASNGQPGQCNPASFPHCCSEHGWCGNTDAHCKCHRCVDYGVPCSSFGGQCIIFHEDSKTWDQAVTSCEAKGQRLAVPQDPVAFHAYMLSNHDGERFWLGGSDQKHEGTWTWINGQSLTGFPWGPGQSTGINQDCLEWGYGNNYNDLGCTTTQRYICEPDDACKNAGGHAWVGSQCLTFNSEALSWTDATQACEVKGQHLASLANSREVYDYVTTKYAARKLFWVGASDARKEGSWEWYDGRPMATGEVPWNAGEPNNCCGGEDCLLMSAGVGYNDDGCAKKLPFICAIDDACKNAGGHALVGSQCLTFNSEALSYTDAIQACEVKGHQLVSLAKPREVYDYVTTHYAAGKLFWVGASDARKEGSWEWYDGRPMATGEVPWNAGEPNNCCGGEDCLLMSAGVGYNDDGCTKKLPFICAIGCMFRGQAYPHEAKIEQSCMELNCINGNWNYTGKINDECGECQVYGDPHVITFDYHSGERPWGYTFLGTGTYTVTQNGMGSQSDYGVISKFIDCELYGTYSCVNSATYYEPGIEITMILPKSRCNVSEDPHCAMTVVVNGIVQTIGKSVHEFYGSGGTIFVFEYNPFYIHPQFHYCIHIAGTKGLSVRLCSNNGGHAHLYVWAMSSLKSKESQLYGMCGTYTETVTACYSHRDNICDKDTCEFVKSWVVDGEPNCGPDPLPPTLCDTNTTTANHISNICSKLHTITCERNPFLCQEYKETCIFDLCRLHTLDAGKKRIISCSLKAMTAAIAGCTAAGAAFSCLFAGPFCPAIIALCATTACLLTEKHCTHECQNGGYCNIGASICQCPSGWSGGACEKKECTSKCQNGGICSAAGVCRCPVGWSGGACDQNDECGETVFSGNEELRSHRIIGGQYARKGDSPWMVMLKIYDKNGDNDLCGGSIISKRWILSAAHCFTSEVTITRLHIYVGARNFELASILKYTKQEIDDRVTKHPLYNDITEDHDIALIQLKEDLVFGILIRPVCLAEDTDFEAGLSAVVTGWGNTKCDTQTLPAVLQTIEVYTMERILCKNRFGNTLDIITDNMICALNTGKQPYQGDSGGPLVVYRDDRWIQIGTVKGGKGCGNNLPSIYMDVAKYRTFIDTVVTGEHN